MFEKTITNALLSSSLQGKLRTYVRRQHSAVNKRLFLTLLSGLFLFLQYLGLFYSQQPSNSTIQDPVEYGGITSHQALVARYDTPTSNTHQLAALLALSRSDLERTQQSSSLSSSSSALVEWNLSPIYSSSLSTLTRITPSFVAQGSANTIFYGHLITLKPANNAANFYGYSRSSGDFAIIKATGDFVTNLKTATKINMCGKTKLAQISTYRPSYKGIQTTVKINNVTTKTPVQLVALRPSNQLLYTLSAKNTTNRSISFSPKAYVGDALEYAHLSDYVGASFNSRDQFLSWPSLVLKPQETASQTFKVQVFSAIPTVAENTTNKASDDCTLSVYFGDTYSLPLACPAPKIIERALHAPLQPVLLVLSWVVFIINIFIYLRNYLIYKELNLILDSMRRK